MYLLRQDQGRQISPYGQARQQQELMEPDTGAVVGAMVEEATSGIGTLAADIAAYGVTEDEKLGTPLSKDQYRESAHYRETIPYYRGMTNASASALAEYDDEAQKRAEIIGEATGGQYALGMTAAFGVGVFEPKNVATGLLTSLVLTPAAGFVGPAAGSIRRLMKMRQMSGQYGGKIALGAIEGGVSAAIAEPSNQYSASILKQDYTMADSAWNIALSLAFGMGASAAGVGAPIIRDKWQQHGARTPDVIASEFDTAVSQLSQGKRVDVGAVERSQPIGRTVAEQARAAETFVRYTETPEFKARFEGASPDVKSSDGTPIRLYHGTEVTQPIKLDINKGKAPAIFLTDNPDVSGTYAKDGQTQIYYANLKNPLVIDALGADYQHIPSPKDVAKELGPHIGTDYLAYYAKERGYDGVIVKNTRDALLGTEDKVSAPSTVYMAFDNNQLISAFGADDLPAITKRMAEENTTSLRKAITDDLDPNNDTAIDKAAWSALDDAETEWATDIEKADQAAYEKYTAELIAKKKEGLLSEADEKAIKEAYSELHEKELNAAWDDLYACLTRG